MPATISLRALGLNTSPSQLSVPEGSLSEASNIIIRRDGIIEPRRGFKLYGDSFPTSTDRATQLSTYKNRILRYYANRLQFDDGTGTFSTFSGIFNPVEPGLRIKSIESNNNYYFTTDDGIKKISSKSGDEFTTSANYITPSGGIKAIDFEALLQNPLGDQTGFLPNDAAVAYRVVWGTKDANANLILGSPSSRVEVFNYFLPTLLRDFVHLLITLDTINQGGCLISDGDYLDTLKLDITASATDLYNNITALSIKLDADILLADQAAVAPLQISSATISGTTCEIVFTSDPSSYISVGSHIKLGSSTPPTIGFTPVSGVLDGGQTVLSVNSPTPNSITFTTTASGAVTIDPTAIITSNEYENIFTVTPLIQPGTLPNHLELQALQDAINSILTQLRLEPNAIIPTAIRTTYLDTFDLTTTAEVQLTVAIPQDITENYFLQLYRSAVSPAGSGQNLIFDVTPSDEMQLVYEAFPTAVEITAGQIVFIDNASDAFKGANLYTNQFSGEGILQSNDPPPLAKDINRFKNYIFFANTKTKHKYNSALVGVQKMIDDALLGDIPTIVITNTTSSNIYRFILGEAESTKITCGTGGTLNSSGVASYWLLNSANDEQKFYIWYKIGTATDPAISGYSGIEVDALAGDTATQIAEKTNEQVSLYNNLFAVSNTGADLTITNLTEGYTTDVDAGTSGFTITNLQQGQGEKVTREESQFTTVPDVAGSLAGTYFLINTAEDRDQNYVWYKVSNVGADPVVANKVGIRVDITTGDSDATVATKTADALNTTGKYVCEAVGNVLDIKSFTYGPATDYGVGTSGFTVTKIEDGALEVLLSQITSPAQAIDLTARSLVRVINRNLAEILYAYYLSGAGDTPGIFSLEAKQLNTSQYFILANSSNTGISFAPQISPTQTISSITTGDPTTMTVVTSSPHNLINQDTIIISGTDSVPPIDGYRQITYVNPTTFRVNVTVTTNGTTGMFIPSPIAESSENEEKVNRIYYSKVNQPEAVPSLVNFFDVGASNKAILRIFPLRDSLFVFKEDGLYRVSGLIAPFTQALFDSSCNIIAADSISVANNNIYGWTSQGVATITEAGVSIISRPIDNQVLKLASSQYTGFKTATWGIGYDSDNAYYAFTVKNLTDTFATTCYRYSNLTNSWTILDKTSLCGTINPLDDKLYLGASDVSFIEQERKSFSRLDYTDRDFTINLGPMNYVKTSKTIQLGSVSGIGVGDSIVQVQYLTPYDYNMLLKKLDIDPGVNDDDYFSTLESKAGDNLRTKIEALANKLDADTGINDSDYFSTIDTKSGTITDISVANPTVITSASHGLVDGRQIVISGTDSIPVADGNFMISSPTINTFTIDQSIISPGTTGTFNTDINSFQDIRACYNAIIRKLNLDIGVSFSNYSQNLNNTTLEAIVDNVNTATKILTINIGIDYVVGPITVFKAIKSTFTYSPNHMQDPLGFKHLREATVMFANKAFTRALVEFSTDLMPAYEGIVFQGSGNGIFGHIENFGDNYFGGNSFSAPFRTIIPRNHQRCRYINVRFTHQIARESYLLYGTTLTGEVGLSTRAYRS